MRTPNKYEAVIIEAEELYKNDKNRIICDIVFNWLYVAIKTVEDVIKATKQPPPVLKSGGFVKEHESKNGIITVPEGSEIIPHGIAEKIAKENKPKNLEVNVKDINIERLLNDTKKK